MGGYASGRKIIGNSGSKETVWMYSREHINGERITELEIEDDTSLLCVNMTVADWEWLKKEVDDAIAFLSKKE